MPYFAVFFFVALLTVAGFADSTWKVVTGELSVVMQLQKKIDRSNERVVISYNSVSGEVRILEAEATAQGAIKEKWNCIRQSNPVAGGIEMIFAEHSLIRSIKANDVDCESLYGPFLLEKGTGKLWRLVDLNGQNKWQEVPLPKPVENGKWSISSAEHTLAMMEMRRQNIYSVFLTEETTGTVYMVESHYDPKKGQIWDKLILISLPGNDVKIK